MQWSLFLLILMRQCSFFTCHLYVYHFIGENKTWDEAQKYCREMYTDLATVSDMTDMERLCYSTDNLSEAWIGLHSYPGKGNRTWYWSLPGLEFNESQARWDSGQPDDYQGKLENCVLMKNHEWSDYPCHDAYKFFCFKESESQSDKSFNFIDTKMTWPQAQNYCRQYYTDLVSGFDQLDDNSIKSQSSVWIGLFRDTWRWSDGKNFSFRNWENVADLVDGQSDKICATVLNRAGTWSSDYCYNSKPFFCYDDKVFLIKENKTWVEALNYCRDNYRDLVSIIDLHQQRWVQEKAKNATTNFVWIGLHYSCTLDFWFWVSDKVVSYNNWASGLMMNDDCDTSAVMERGEHNQWFKKPDTEKFNFICSKF